MIQYLKTKKFSEKVGMVLALLHLLLVYYVARFLVLSDDPARPLIWYIIYIVDLPVVLMSMLLSLSLDFLSVNTDIISSLLSSDMGGSIFFGFFGTLYHLLIPSFIANTSSLIKQKKKKPAWSLLVAILTSHYVAIAFLIAVSVYNAVSVWLFYAFKK